MTNQRDTAKRWRPWQFSLRTLMLIMFGVACFFGGWQANEWERRREMERAQQEAWAPIDVMTKAMEGADFAE